MKIFRGLRLVFRILRAIGEVEEVNPQRIRRIIHDWDTLTLQQDNNRQVLVRVQDLEDQIRLLVEANNNLAQRLKDLGAWE